MRPVAVRTVPRLFAGAEEEVSVLLRGEAHRGEARRFGLVRAVAEGL